MCGSNNIVVNCGCCGKDTDNSTGADNTPVGTVISYMGTSAPDHYLTCDGAVYNISDYKEFSQFIKNQFGSHDYFGGDGISTFAVPDLRDEFLRGYHGDKEGKLSGEIGVHQDSTQIPSGIFSATNTRIYTPTGSEQYLPLNYDSIYRNSNDTKTLMFTPDSSDANLFPDAVGLIKARPTNTAVLYCIKYE